MIEIPQSVMDAYDEPHRKYHDKHTATGYALWENVARRNMERELSFLEGKYGGH